jgi:transcriptional regulator with XRE-family HTH domain
MSHEDIFINGELLRLRREARGWVLADMATRACMSVKQIRQIEEGGMSSFYSTAVKVTAAKKVAVLLGLSADEIFTQTFESDDAVADASPLEAVVEHEVPVEAAAEPVAAQSLTDSKDSELASLPVAEEPTVDAFIHSPAAAMQQEEAPKSKISLWLIAVLFLMALAGTTYWQSQEDPVTEPVPPLQVLPVEEPASGASAAEGAASVAVEVASTAVSIPSAAIIPVPVASTSRIPAIAASSAIRPASASAVVPVAASASKAP